MSRRTLAVAAIVAFCVSCAPREAPREQVAVGEAALAVPVDGGTLVRRLEVDVSTLNPVLSTSRYDRFVANYLFVPLVYLDRELRPIPGLATSWEVLDGGRVYRFHLDPRATFSDGAPVRATDVLFTLRKVIDPKVEAVQIAPGFEQLDLERTRVIDDGTIEIAFRQPLAAQLIRFNDLLVLPEHVYSVGDFRADFHTRAVGCGPYRVVRRDIGKEIVLERRPDFQGTRPHIQTVVFKVVSDHATAWSALRRGDIDETFLLSDTWQRARKNPAHEQMIEFQRFYTLNYNFIAWNTRDPVLSDRRVRRALASCIPLESIVQDLYHGTARAMSGPFTPDEFAYNPRVPVIRHDPAEGKRLLASAGWRDSDEDGVLDRDGRALRLELAILSGSSTTKQFAQLVQSEVRKLGVGLEITILDSATFFERVLGGEFQAAYLGWDLDPDPDPYAIFHSSQFPPQGQNFVFYRNAEADELMDRARVELDRAKRRASYWRLHEILAVDQPYTWIVQGSSKWGINRRVQGVAVSPGYGLFLWYPGELAWWIRPVVPADDRARR